MDILEDTSQALRSYLRLSASLVEKGDAYFAIFGALQALYVQQDATWWLSRSLGRPRAVAAFRKPGLWIRTIEPLRRIREVRNNSVGHPVSSDFGTTKRSFFITQWSLNAQGFELRSSDTAGPSDPIFISVPDLVEVQLNELTSILRIALEEIMTDERAYRAAFRDVLLEPIFRSLGHPLEKLGAAAGSYEPKGLGLYGVEKVRTAMMTFTERLSARSEPIPDMVQLIFRRLDVALEA